MLPRPSLLTSSLPSISHMHKAVKRAVMDDRVALFSSTTIPPKIRHRNTEQEQLCRVTSAACSYVPWFLSARRTDL